MNNWLRIAFGVIVLVHGIGHILFLLPALGIAEWGQSTRSWLLSKPLGDGLTRCLGAILWIAATLAFVAGVIGLFIHAGWWQVSLTIASGISAAGLILFWTSPASSSAIFALVVDLGIIVAIQVFHWPSA